MLCYKMLQVPVLLNSTYSKIATSGDRGKLSGLLQFMLSWGFFIAQWLGYGCFQVNSDFHVSKRDFKLK